jgi:acid phosphatase
MRVWYGDICKVCWEAKSYLRSLPAPKGNEKFAIVFDIDDTALSTWSEIEAYDFGYIEEQWKKWMTDETKFLPAIEPVFDVYRNAVKQGITVFFITGRRKDMEKATKQNLRQAGYATWEDVMMRPIDDRDESVIPFKVSARKSIEEKGYRIIANIGDQESDLVGGYAERTFKIPNPAYIVK